MLKHQQFAEDLALLALGELDRDRAHDLILHLERCTSCREQYEQLVTEADLLDISGNGTVTPPVFESAIEIEPEHLEAAAIYRLRPRWWTLAPFFALGVLVLFSVLLWTDNRDLRQELRQIRSQVEKQTGALLFELHAPASLSNAATVSEKAPPHGHVLYHKAQRTLMFLGSNLPTLSKDRTYQLWLIPSKGDPISTGIFEPDSTGMATLTRNSLPQDLDPANFAVTIEPLGGSDSPSLPAIISGY
jgi:hypothetical protein